MITQQEASWLASLSMLGAWFGAMLGDWVMRKGRRLALRMSCLPLALAWLVTGFSPYVELIYVMSFVGGLCCSIIAMVAQVRTTRDPLPDVPSTSLSPSSQVYISEISLPGIRGCLSAILKVLGHVGVLLSYVAGSYLNWRQSALLVAIAPSMLFLGTLFIPETPSYLILNGKDDEAASSLQWLRGTRADITYELQVRPIIIITRLKYDAPHTLPPQIIKSNILASRARNYELSFRNSICTPRLYKPIGITCGLMFFQRFSGANAFSSYAVVIFRKTLRDYNPHNATIAIGFVQLLASLLSGSFLAYRGKAESLLTRCLPSGFLIDIVGRLPLLITSTVFMSVALAGFGSYAYLNSMTALQQQTRAQQLGDLVYDNVDAGSGQYDWIPLLCVIVFTTALALGISPISWLLIGELFPLEYRGLGSSISTSFSYFCSFLGIKLFMDFQQVIKLDFGPLGQIRSCLFKITQTG